MTSMRAQPTAAEWRFERIAPSGQLWQRGPADATQQVTGPPITFCLLVGKRRPHQDLEIVASGADAERWLDIAEAYRGPSRALVAMGNADGSAGPMGTRSRAGVQGSFCSPAAVSR
jgi:hypothetical protein